MANSVIVRKGTDESNEHWKCFPPFLWLLRDMLVSMPERRGKKLTPTKYLKSVVLGGDQSDSMKTAVRKSLTESFPSFECRTLPPPSTDATVMENVSTSMEKLDKLFNQGVNQLIACVKQEIKPKQMFDAPGTKCDGATFAVFVKGVIKAVNDPDSIPALDNTWKMVVESRCKTVQETLLLEYSNSIRDRYDENSQGRPLEEVAGKNSLMEIHDTLWSEINKKLDNEVRPLLALEVTEKYTLKIVTDQLEKQLIQTQGGTDSRRLVVGGALFPIIEKNRERSRKFCDDLYLKLYAPIQERVQRTTDEDEYTPEQLAADVVALFEEYDAQSIGPEKLRTRAQIEASLDQHKKLFRAHLQQVSQHAKNDREQKEEVEGLRSELREAKENQKQIDEYIADFKKDLQESEERRQKEIRELKEKVEEQRQIEKEMAEEEIERRVKEAQQLTEENFKRERAEKELKLMEETLRKTKGEAAVQQKTAESEIQKMELSIKENKLEEAKRKNKTEKEMNDLKAQIEEWQQRLGQKEKDHEDQVAKTDAKIKKMQQNLTDQKDKSAEERDKQKRIVKEKEDKIKKQQSEMKEMEADHEDVVRKINAEKEEERRLREVAEEETRTTLERLDKSIKEGEKQNATLEKKLKDQLEKNEEQKAFLSGKVKKLNDDIDKFEKRSFIVRAFKKVRS